MKKVSLFLIFNLLIICSVGQNQVKYDKLIYLDKTSLECKVLRVTENSIEVDPIGSNPFLIIERIKVSYIIYSDNTVVNFEDSGLSENRNETANTNIGNSANQYDINTSWSNCYNGYVNKITFPDCPDQFTWNPCVGKIHDEQTGEIIGCDNKSKLKVTYVLNFRYEVNVGAPFGIKWNIGVSDISLYVKVAKDDIKLYEQTMSFPNQKLYERSGAEFPIGSFEYKGQTFKVLLLFHDMYTVSQYVLKSFYKVFVGPEKFIAENR